MLNLKTLKVYIKIMFGLIAPIINSLDTSNVTVQESAKVLLIVLSILYTVKQKNPIKFKLLANMCNNMLAGVKFKNFVAYIKHMGIEKFQSMVRAVEN
jgi:hypothetical protein